MHHLNFTEKHIFQYQFNIIRDFRLNEGFKKIGPILKRENINEIPPSLAITIDGISPKKFDIPKDDSVISLKYFISDLDFVIFNSTGKKKRCTRYMFSKFGFFW